MIKSVTEVRIYHEVASLRDSSLLGPSVCCLLVCLSVVCCLLVLQPVYPGTELASEMTQNPAQKSLEDMASSDVVQWLSKFAGQKFNQDIFDAIEGIVTCSQVKDYFLTFLITLLKLHFLHRR